VQILQSLVERRDLSEELTQEALKVQLYCLLDRVVGASRTLLNPGALWFLLQKSNLCQNIAEFVTGYGGSRD
jgi:hypothetical protein